MDTLHHLEQVEGNNTELVSLVLPAGYDIREAVALLEQEQAEARNIKDKQTRKNVTAALKKAERRLRELGTIPENGVGVYAGSIKQGRGKSALESWVVEPQNPVQEKLYRCSNTFHLQPIKDAHRSTGMYGIIVVDRDKAAIGRIQNGQVHTVSVYDANIPGKHTKGGQSQGRFESLRENMIQTFLSDTADRAKHRFIDPVRNGDCHGIVIAGPGQMKQKLVDNHLHGELREQVMAQVDTNYSGEQGLKQALGNVDLPDAAVVKQRQLVDRFFNELAEDTGKAVYGDELVETALQYGAVDTLLVPETGECV